jgi:hypothetical protein
MPPTESPADRLEQLRLRAEKEVLRAYAASWKRDILFLTLSLIAAAAFLASVAWELSR